MMAIVVLLMPLHVERGEAVSVRVRVGEARSAMAVEHSGPIAARVGRAREVMLVAPIEIRGGFEMVARDASGREVRGRGPIEFRSVMGSTLRSDGRVLGPEIVCVWREGEVFDVVRPVELELYVAGVLGGELFGHWPDSCFEAQAICARSYVVHEMGRATERHYDVNDDQRHQVFAGGEPLEKATRAAERTRGLVLMSEGRVLRTYFASACGGRAASAAMVWPAKGRLEFNAAEPLGGHPRAHACDDAPLYRWSRRRGREEVSSRVRSWATAAGHAARGMGSIVRVEVIEVAPSGRPGVYLVVDDRHGRYRFLADDLRVAMNDGRPMPLSAADRLPSNDFEVEVLGDRVTIRGRGFGHGVGLCQYCAAQWAREGYSALDMLGAFFPGARLGRVEEVR